MKNRASTAVALIVFLYLLGYLVPSFAIRSWHRPGPLVVYGMGFRGASAPVFPAPQFAIWYDKAYHPLQMLDRMLTDQWCSPNRFDTVNDYRF